ncbi:MAG: DUF4347 domain-containing protein [Gallionella sp.]|nr:DUF4347 domain-containing protein [Gallionella sp.]
MKYVNLSTQSTTNALLFGTRWGVAGVAMTDITYIVFIDGSFPGLQTIFTGLDPSVTAIVLDPAQDGIRQMADALAGMSGLSAIHIISHGTSGQINLGTAQLSQDTLAQYRTQLATIGNALSATGDLLLYGCNIAQGDVGQAFISALASVTGADVAASTDLTGAAFIGLDWQLEAQTGVGSKKLPMAFDIGIAIHGAGA